MVLFITGVCRRTCWYCPLSGERKGHDNIYANERQVQSPEEAIEVARRMSALGTSITGGEPLERLERVVSYCHSLKKEFGKDHYIHLYTGRAPDDQTLNTLRGAIDEIRLHPPYEAWECITESEYYKSARTAKGLGFTTGFEVPALPDIELLEPVLPLLDFLNINELEWGGYNAAEMRKRGYIPEDGLHNAVLGARDWTRKISKEPRVHFCSSSFKDSVQLRRRLIRVARNTARPFDHVTRDGTIVYGSIEPSEYDRDWVQQLKAGSYEDFGDHIELSWREVKKNAETLFGKCSIVERYPERGMVVEVTPI